MRVPPRFLAAAAVAAVSAFLLLMLNDDRSGGDAHPLLLPRARLGSSGGWVELERARPGTLPRLRIVAGRVYDEGAIRSTLHYFDRVLELRRPFTVLWDPRRVLWPRVGRPELRVMRQWVDANAARWDSRVQAHAVVIANPILRSIAHLAIGLFAPPQPTRVVSNLEAADVAAQSWGRASRSWVKSSYADRDQRFRVFGGEMGVR